VLTRTLARDSLNHGGITDNVTSKNGCRHTVAYNEERVRHCVLSRFGMDVAEASETTELVVFPAWGNCCEISRGRDFNFEETEKLRAQTPEDAKPLKVDRKSARTEKESSAELGAIQRALPVRKTEKNLFFRNRARN